MAEKRRIFAPRFPALLLVSAALLLLLPPSPAVACSLAYVPQPRDSIDRSSGAFVGALVRQSDFRGDGTSADTKYTFLVEWVIKGNIKRRIDVISSTNEGMCGIGVIPAGKRVGLVVKGYPGRWGADMGDLFEADALLAAARPGEALRLGPLGLLQRWNIWIQTIGISSFVIVGLLALFFFLILRTARAPRSTAEPMKTNR